jgi:hypothetical protein
MHSNWIASESVAVAFDGLVVFAVGSLQQSVDVPADVALDVVAQALLCTLISLGLFVAIVVNESSHRKCF